MLLVVHHLLLLSLGGCMLVGSCWRGMLLVVHHLLLLCLGGCVLGGCNWRGVLLIFFGRDSRSL